VADASLEEVNITNRAATLAELEAGKVAPTDILSLPMFKVRFFLPQEQKPTDTDSSFLKFRLDELVSIGPLVILYEVLFVQNAMLPIHEI
jgi:hypothetical protein